MSKKKHQKQTSSIGFNKSRYYDDDYYTDYYDSGYKPSSTYNRGGYSSYGSGSYGSSNKNNYNNWSWGSFGGYSFNEDEDDKLYIKNHESYFTPKSDDISSKINYQYSTKSNKDLIKEMSRYFYYKMLDDKEYFEDKYLNPDKLSESELESFEQKKLFYEELWDKFVPGVTPLEKALAIFSQLTDKNKDKNKSDFDPTDLQEVAEGVQFNEELYNDPTINELLDMNSFGKKYKMDILNKISLIQNLGSEFKVEKEISEKIVANSNLITKKIMRDYSQLHNVELYQRLMPTFNLKLLTKDLIINTPVERTEHKQKIITILDYSGSMNSLDKQSWVVAILIDRLKYVMKQEAEVFFSYFVHDANALRFTHLHNRETALKFWQTFSNTPNGGTTDIGAMVNRIKYEIESKRLMNLSVDLSEEKPEILVLNDGQDSIHVKEFTYKTNGISILDGNNPDLKTLCVKNDGKYVLIKGKTMMLSSKSGEQEMKIS